MLHAAAEQREEQPPSGVPVGSDHQVRDEVRAALAISPSATLAHRTIDITTTGRRSGSPRRIEICFYRVDDSIYLSGVPAPRRRGRLANLVSNPHFLFHLKGAVAADVAAVGTRSPTQTNGDALSAPLWRSSTPATTRRARGRRPSSASGQHKAQPARVRFVDDN